MAAKVLLQDPLTGFYFRGFGTWTNDPERAIIFSSEREAREFCLRASMANIQIQNLRHARSLHKLAIRKTRTDLSRLRSSPPVLDTSRSSG